MTYDLKNVIDVYREASSFSETKILHWSSSMILQPTMVKSASPPKVSFIFIRLFCVQQDRDPNQENPKHVTIIGRDG